MRTLRTAIAALFAVVVVAGAMPATAADAPALKFGMDRDSIQAQVDLGIAPDYGQFWAGVWNERSGWDSLSGYADSISDRGITPVVEWWYWGDDISPSCVLNGCWSNLHDAHKDRARWRADAERLADALHRGLQGRQGILVIESEFNKNGVATWEEFDGMLAEHARIFRARAPELKLVLGIGNWDPGNWYRWDRAAAAMDLVGTQALRGSTRDTVSSYLAVVDDIQTATSKLKSLFGKPVFLHDFTVSSYGTGFEGHQETVVREFMGRLDTLKANGLMGVIWRDIRDTPSFDTANYYGVAERYKGLIRADGSHKPALDDWVRGVKAERGGSAPAPTPAPAPGGSFAATFDPRSETNNWWVDVKVSSASTIAKVEARKDGGSWIALSKTSWGTWAKSFHVPDGAKVEFRATSGSGATATSAAYTWGGASAPPAGDFTASFDPRSETNNWWVEVKVTSASSVAKVEARKDGGSWIALSKTSWGTWAKSFHVPDGAKVEFRATDTQRRTDLSPAYTWG